MTSQKLFGAAALMAAVAVLAAAGTAWATGQPEPWQIGFQPAATPVMADIESFHNLLLVISAVIFTLVTVLMLIVIVRFNAKANPVPSKTTHNTLIEVLWTVIPVMILVVIAIPSFRLLYFQDRAQNAELTIKAIGHQWYWTYQYPDNGDFEFDAIMLADDELGAGQPRLLATDESVVLPINTEIRLLVTADDVIHAWAIPSFGVKMDATPGQVNETWFSIDHEGMYYGQCSELCGAYHGFMPIQVKAVSKQAYAEWVAEAQEEYAQGDAAPVLLAGDESAAAKR